MAKIQELLDNLLHKKLGRDVRQSIHDSIEQCYKDATGHPESVAGVIEENKNMQKQLDSNINTINGRIDTILTGTVNTTKLVTVHSATIRNNSASDLTFKISSKDNETLKSIKDKSPTVINANVIAKSLDGVAINGKGIPSSYNVESTNDEYVITVYSGSSSVVGQYVFMAVVTIAYEDIATDISSAELKDVRAGADGTVYKSAGEAVRQQIGSLKESLADNTTRLGVATKSFSVSNKTHSSVDDQIYLQLPSGTKYNVFYEANKKLTTNLFVRYSDGTEKNYGSCDYKQAISEKIETKDIVSIGLYINDEDYTGQVKLIVELKESISKKIAITEKNVLNYTGLASDIFAIKIGAQSDHSSMKDRIDCDITRDEYYYIYCSTGTETPVTVQLYGLAENDNDGESIITFDVKKTYMKKIQTNNDYKRIGVYVSNDNDSEIDVKLYFVKNEMCVKERIVNTQNISDFFENTNRENVRIVNDENGVMLFIKYRLCLQSKLFNVTYSAEDIYKLFNGDYTCTLDRDECSILVPTGNCLCYDYLTESLVIVPRQSVENDMSARYIVLLRVIANKAQSGLFYNRILKNQMETISKTTAVFIVNANSSHSSLQDRIFTEVLPGIKYNVVVTSDCDIGFQLFGYPDYGAVINGNVKGKGTKALEFTLTKKVDNFGIYVSNNTGKNATVSFYVFRDDTDKVATIHDFYATQAIESDNFDSQVKKYSALLKNESANTEQFLFFTDPHTMGSVVNEFELGLGTVEKAFNKTPTDFVLCGGDWLQNSDTQDEACYKLGVIDASMRKKFGNKYYPIIGNHDTNYQGVDDNGKENSGRLSKNSLKNLWFREYGSAYYTFKTLNSRFYIFDTETDWDGTMSEYRWKQIDWFANGLKDNDDSHSVIGLHIFTNQTKEILQQNVVPQQLALNVTLIAKAYNNKERTTINGKIYDFTNCHGKVEFLICGHSHYDAEFKYNNIPIIITTNAGYDQNATFDLCYVDYDEKRIKLIRIGQGDDRDIDIS